MTPVLLKPAAQQRIEKFDEDIALQGAREALARLEEATAAAPRENKTARGPVPTPRPQSAKKRKRRAARAARAANR